jgi:hypothetical protein
MRKNMPEPEKIKMRDLEIDRTKSKAKFFKPNHDKIKKIKNHFSLPQNGKR